MNEEPFWQWLRKEALHYAATRGVTPRESYKESVEIEEVSTPVEVDSKEIKKSA